MNNTLPFSASAPALHHQTTVPLAKTSSLFSRLLKTVAAFFAPGDDPAALRYIASKYNGQGD